MFWAAKRKTKRKKNKVYSLLGIFDIHILLIYSEGMKDIHRRLLNEIYNASRGTHITD